MYYRVVYDGLAHTYVSTVSGSSVKVLPKVMVKRPGAPASGQGTLRFTTTGGLQPKHASGTKQIKIQAYRLVKGKWILKSTFNTKVTASGSKYKGRVVLKSGTWRLRAYHKGDALNSAAYSDWRYMVVR